MPENEQTSSDFFKELDTQLQRYKNSTTALIEDIAKAVTNITYYGNELNKTFGQGRQRIVEIQTAIADNIPGITRLGGDISAVQKTMSDIAEASRRNVIATTQQTEQLYAATKVVGESAKYLVDSFTDVGVGLGQMTKQIQDSVLYIQSIGGNTKQVFKVVTDNMDQLNRYQFDGGVQGLTKMAAQASMLRYDMRETFRLADTLYKPERAVEVAAAFQRLGLAVGDLGDPFRLMSDSIMNPEGLQDSLVQMTKQFTYFDDKTKTFKISPDGVLRLKELQEQTGISAQEMTKLGLAAKEADARLAAISSVGLNVKEEDKQLLANIARMGEGGEYEIQVKDDKTGKMYYEKLTNISQDQLNATLKQQKEGPKTLEEIARASMNYDEILSNDVKSILHGLMYGFATPQKGLEGIESVRNLTEKITGLASKMFGTTKTGRRMSATAIDDIQQLFKDLRDPKKGANEAFASLAEKIGRQSDEFGADFKDSMIEYLNKLSDKLDTKGGLETGAKSLIDQLLGDKRTPGAPQGTSDLYNNLLGKTEPINISREAGSPLNNQTVNVNYTFDPLEVKISGDAGKLDGQQITTQINQALTSAISKLPPTMIWNSQQFWNPTKTGPITAPFIINQNPNNTAVK